MYNDNEIKNLLKCELCTLKYLKNDQPRYLPCGKTVCDRCLSSIEKKLVCSLFRCEFCQNKHLMVNKESFRLNQLVLNLLNDEEEEDKEIDFVYKTEYKSDLNGADALYDEIFYELNNCEMKIKQHFNNLRNKVNSSAQMRIDAINSKTSETLNRINEYEVECINKLNNSNNELKSKISLLESQSEHNLNLIEKLNDLKANLDYYLFSKEKIEFNESELLKGDNLIGYLKASPLKSTSLDESKNKNIFTDNYVTCMQITDDFMIATSSRGDIKIYKLTNNSINHECYAHIQGAHKSDILCIALISNERFITGSKDGYIKIFDIPLKECIKEIDQKHLWITCIKMLDKKTCLIASSDGLFKIYEMNSWKCIKSFSEESGWLYTLQLIPQSSKFVIGSNSDVKIWDYQLGICVKELSGHASSINCIEIITNKYVISAGYKEVKIWNIDSSKAEKTIICHQNWIKCLKVLSRNIFITGSFDNKLKMWNSSTGECLKVFSSHTESVWCIELFSDDKFFTSSRDRTIKLWSYLNGECIKTIQF